jgi:hypothetical protein
MLRLAFIAGALLLVAAAAIMLFLRSERAARPPHAAPEHGAAPSHDRDASVEELDVRSPARRALKLRALGGSVEAAEELMARAGHCNLSHGLKGPPSDRCTEISSFWFDIALQNGSPAAAQWRTRGLLYSERCGDIHRAEYWYKRHASAFADHKRLLKSERKQIEEKKRTCSW